MHMRMLTTLALILTLLASAFATASARGAMAGTLDMVICTGQGMATIQVNAKGDPVDPRHTCPDCVLTLAVPIPGSVKLVPQQHILVALNWTAPTAIWITRSTLTPSARDPPSAA